MCRDECKLGYINTILGKLLSVNGLKNREFWTPSGPLDIFGDKKEAAKLAKPLFLLAPAVGIEPTTN